MLVSWKWLSRYVDLPMPLAELEQRLALSGLNHESTEPAGDDFVIDLEVTSNRGDCLGHIGVAREISVLYDLPLRLPIVDQDAGDQVPSDDSLVTNQSPQSCSHYVARVLQGVTVGPSPAWLADSLQAIGVNSVNNVVDATNYVMFECGQPLHAFDLDRLAGKRVIVRQARPGETITAIDHRTYTLDESMCVIADTEKAVAVAGVMGGAGSEVTGLTHNLLIESAIFAPLSVRRTARKLKLFSPSSFRFERRMDPQQQDWACRRVCEIIIATGGGQIVGVGTDGAFQPPQTSTVQLRFGKLNGLLGITIDPAETQRILVALGCEVVAQSSDGLTLRPPSWRHDLTREVDLIEEVARIYGYDKIPEDCPVPVVASSKRPFDVAVEKIRGVLVSGGISEAMTPSVVTDSLDAMMSPWTERDALATHVPMLEGARKLRRSLLPSLLNSRATNWHAAGVPADLFEIAHIYLPGPDAADLPLEQYSLGIVSGRDFYEVKGLVDELVVRLGLPEPLSYQPASRPGLDDDWTVTLVGPQGTVGYLSVVDAAICKSLKMPESVIAVEIAITTLLESAQLVPQQRLVSSFPAIERDLNLIMSESVRWSDLENAVRGAVGTELTAVRFKEIYRNPAKDGEDRKRVLLSIELRKSDGTLTGGDADKIVASILSQCDRLVGATLLT